MKKNDTLLRHWRMLREIPRHPRRISTATLKERLLVAGFETTLRTIQRDLIKLSESLPLIADDAKPQGWSWQADAPQLDLPTLEPQAALIFYLAEKYLQPLLPASTLDYLSPWFRTASGVLDVHGNGLSSWRDKVRVLAAGQPKLPPTITNEVQAVVTQALLQGRQIDVVYRPAGATEDKRYNANLLGLVLRDNVTYIVCTLREYDNVKQLVLHRVRSARLLDTSVRLISGFDLDRYIADGEFGIPSEPGKKIQMVANFDKEVAKKFVECPLDANQVVEHLDDQRVQLRVEIPDTQEIRQWLLEFGAQVEVIAPESLRQEMKAVVVEMSKRYGL